MEDTQRKRWIVEFNNVKNLWTDDYVLAVTKEEAIEKVKREYPSEYKNLGIRAIYWRNFA